VSSVFSLPPVLQDYAAAGRSVEAHDRAKGDSFRAVFDGVLAKAETKPAKREPTVVAPRTTKLSGSEAKAALTQAWRNVYGEEPNEKTSQILLAQWSLETGRGKAMMNYNFGGIKGAGPSGLTARYGTHEVENGKTVAITDGFRAYESPEEGATDYVRLLSKRYGSALDAARAGDPQGFVRGLKKNGYFTAPEAQYSAAITSLTNRAATLGADAIGDLEGGAATASHAPRVNGAPRIGAHAAPGAIGGFVPPGALGFNANRLRGDELLNDIAEAALGIARGPREQEDQRRREFDDAFHWRF
jgi:Mannosyl-glycoprotein endo-beta-N-acetylglucosaminidase